MSDNLGESVSDAPIALDPVWPDEGAPTPEQIAGRPLVDLSLDELRDLAREVDLDGRSKLNRDELIVALDGDPEAMTEVQREEATAALAKAEAATAPTVDPNELPPWERHEDIEQPVTTEEMLAAMAELQGALTESAIDPESGERKMVTWANVEEHVAAQRAGRALASR